MNKYKVYKYELTWGKLASRIIEIYAENKKSADEIINVYKTRKHFEYTYKGISKTELSLKRLENYYRLFGDDLYKAQMEGVTKGV